MDEKVVGKPVVADSVSHGAKEDKPVKKPPVTVGAPGSYAPKPADNSDVLAVVEEACRHNGGVVVILRSASDIPSVQRVLAQHDNGHIRNIRVNERQEPKALWRVL